MKLLHAIDCAKEYSAEHYFSFHPSRVVKADCGTYRETSPEKFSRFGYRFEIKNVGAPHLAVIRYPDDKRRFMMVNDGTTYDLSTGIITGGAFPLSGEMKELRQVFWPRFRDMSICLMGLGNAEPAAASKIDIYELAEDGLAPVEFLVPVDGGRQLGIQYEDPCGTEASEGAATFSAWLDHLVTHAKHTGQNRLQYPICWYHGPWFPGTSERADAFTMVVAPDRQQYVVWTDTPRDWPSQLLERFDREGLEFQGVFTLMRLSSLMRKMNTDLEAIKHGAPTINNMLWNNKVQVGTMDWTGIYNTILYRDLDKMQKDGGLDAYSRPRTLAYDERAGEPDIPTGPIFNPLHPEVQEIIIRFFSETCRQYANFRSFKGIAVTMWAPTMLWFGSLRSGYDDFTASEFTKETGIKIPVATTDPERFSKRYEFLTYACRPAWLSWRCRRIHHFICRIRDAVTAARPDLRLTINLWSEPYVPAVRGNGDVRHQLHARSSLLELYQEAGLDPSLFASDANVDFDLQLDGGGRDRGSNDGGAAGFMFRDQDYLDQSVWNVLKEQQGPGVFIFQCWHEAWGTHKWFNPEPCDHNLPGIAEVYGQPGHAFRINSEYPKDGFWWDSQLRIAPAFPAAPHYLEHYAHAVAVLDTIRITAGGLFLDKTHNDELRRFAQVFRALPAKPFTPVGASTDPVAVRTLLCHDKLYCYLVNREYYPVEVKLDFAVPPHEWTDLSGTGRSPHAITLDAYELRAFIFDPATTVAGFNATVPKDKQAELEAGYQQARAALAAALLAGCAPVGTETVLAELAAARKAKGWSKLRHLLGSYPVCQCLARAIRAREST